MGFESARVHCVGVLCDPVLVLLQGRGDQKGGEVRVFTTGRGGDGGGRGEGDIEVG